MAGHRCRGRSPPKTHQALFSGFHQCLQCSAGAHGSFPLVCLGEVMHLNQVDLIDLHTFQGSVQLGLGVFVGSVPGLGRQKNRVTVVL